MDKCIGREQGAWEEFLRRYGPIVHRAVTRKLSSLGRAYAGSEADDIFQEVFKDLVENDCRALHSIRSRERIEPWLCAVALHKTIDYVRKRVRNSRYAHEHSHVAERSEPYSPSDSGEADIAEKVSEAVEQLRPEEQLLLKLHYVHQLKYRQIADLANLPINTVSSRLFRIRKKLFRQLSKAGTL